MKLFLQKNAKFSNAGGFTPTPRASGEAPRPPNSPPLRISCYAPGYNEYFVLPSKVHSNSTRFVTGDNYSLTRFNKSNSQRSIRYHEPKIWNELPADIKNIAQKTNTFSSKKLKNFSM